MTPIRILLADMPRLMHDIVASAIAAQTDMELVLMRDERESLSEAVMRTVPDVVLVGSDRTPDAGEVVPLLHARPDMRLITVVDDGRAASLYELRPHQEPVPDVSPDGLVIAIRAAARRGR